MLSWSRLLPFLVFLSTFLLEPISAEWIHYTTDDYQIYACQRAINAKSKKNLGTVAFGKKACKNVSLMGSVMVCLYENNGVNNTSIEDRLIDICAVNNVTVTTNQLRSIYENATNYVQNITTKDQYALINVNTTVVTGPYIQKKYTGWSHSFFSRYQNINYSHYLGMGAIGYWAVVILFAALANWFNYLMVNNKKGGVHFANNKLVNSFRKHITLAPAFKKKHVQNVNKFGFMGFIPDRTETILLSIWILYCILATYILGVRHYSDDYVFPKQSTAIGRYYGDRSAVFVSYILPLLFLFPGRNNFLQWLTRWEYSRFVHIHKWIGRVATMEVLVHSIAMSIQSVAADNIHTRIVAEWFRAGLVGTFADIFLVLLACYAVREHFYEIFVVVHIVLAAVFVATSWVHAYAQEYQQYYIACVAVWAFDRFVRLVRIAFFGVSTADIELVGESTIKVTMKHSRFWKPSPGSHCYVHFLTLKHFYQSHPFSVVISDSNEIVFYCKAKTGITKYLYKKLMESEKLSIQLKCIVEGPYGHETPYHHYDKAVMISGGNGVTGLYSYAQNLCEKYASTEKKEIKFYWGVKNLEVLNWFRDELFKLQKAQDFCKIVIFVSQIDSIVDLNPNSSHSESDSSSNNSEKNSEDKRITSTQLIKPTTSLAEIKEIFNFIDFREGRMDIDAVIEGEIEESQKNSSMAIGACAAPSVNDLIRNKVRNHLSNVNDVKIDYFEEIQTW